MVPAKMYRIARLGSAVVLVATAGRHVVLASRGDGAVVRHVVFGLINVALAGLLVRRPRWAFYPALALGTQQLWSHGLDLSRSFLGTEPLDITSLAVCLFFPTLVTVLFIERSDDSSGADAKT